MMCRNVPAAVVMTLVLMAVAGCSGGRPSVDVEKTSVDEQKVTADAVPEQADPGLYAVIETSMGTIKCKLFPDKTPKTCANFVGLAEGTIAWMDPKTGEQVKRPFYDGLTFHRVIPGFMIQGGCPLGTGTGGPGYTIGCEIDPTLNYDEPGKLAMARGPSMDSVGSQFFITDAPAPHLNGGYTLFGEVVEGLDVVKAIARVPRDRHDKPLEPVIIERVRILRGDQTG